MDKTIRQLITEAHGMAIEHGWWEKPKSMAELLCLVHSEISEALEEERNHKQPREIYYSGKETQNDGAVVIYTAPLPSEMKHWNGQTFESIGPKIDKPEGIPMELADAVIRIFDMCGYYGIDLTAAIEEKMAYNSKRSIRHGGKKL